jgi:hypothetical protein
MREQGANDAPGADQADLPAQQWIDAGNSAGTGPFRSTV